MRTPFNDNFQFQEYDINQTLIQKGYVNFLFVPDLSTVSVDLGEGNSVLSDAYIIEEVTQDNFYLYPDVEIGSYVLTWQLSPSSSSSSSLNQLELKTLLESGLYSIFQVRYISIN